MSTIKTYQEQVQDIVAKAISTVEEQHKLSSLTTGLIPIEFKDIKIIDARIKNQIILND